MKSSPLIPRQSSLRTTESENTPKRKRKDYAERSRSPLSRSWVAWSSKKKSTNRNDKRNEILSSDNIQKELLEYHLNSNYSIPDVQEVTRNITFTEPDDLISRKNNVLKCKNHNESYSFYLVNDKRFLCNKCLYNKVERITSVNFKNSVIPLEKCTEYISRENSHFIDVECQQYLRQLQRNISACHHNNNFLMQKQEILQGIVSTEFENIYQIIKKREDELNETINYFFDQKIKENINQLQNFKLFADSLNKIKDLGKLQGIQQNVYQFSFISKLKASLENINVSTTKFPQKEIDFIGAENKDRIKREVERLGKPLSKFLEAIMAPIKGHNALKTSSDLQSPSKFSKLTPRGQISAQFNKFPGIASEKKEDSTIQLKKSQEFSNIKDLEMLLHSNPTQISNFGNSIFQDSIILNDPQLKDEALNLFLIDIQKTRKLYSLSQDGPRSEIFHQKCNNHGPYIVIIKTDGRNIFGFYSPLHFTSNNKYCGSEDFWIYSLKNDYKKPSIFKIKPEKNFIALYNGSKSLCLGSTIKGKEDLLIDFDNLSVSCSNIAYAYKTYDPKIDGSKILSGKHSGWNFDEIEVYHINT